MNAKLLKNVELWKDTLKRDMKKLTINLCREAETKEDSMEKRLYFLGTETQRLTEPLFQALVIEAISMVDSGDVEKKLSVATWVLTELSNAASEGIDNGVEEFYA